MKLTDDEVSKANGGMGMNMRTMKVCPYCYVHFTGTEKAFNDHVESCKKRHSSMGNEITEASRAMEGYLDTLLK